MSERYPREFDERRVLPLVLGFLPVDVVKSDSVVPVTTGDGSLGMAVLEACDDDTLDKVLFIGNREFGVLEVKPEALQYAIERYCSQPTTGDDVDKFLRDRGVS